LMLPFLICVPAGASSVTSSCSIPYVGGGDQTQTGISAAACDVESVFPLAGQSAVANGSWDSSGASGYAEACCLSDVFATSVITFDETFAAPTVVTFEAVLSGNVSYINGSLGSLTFSCQGQGSENQCYDVETLMPGSYTGQFTAYDSEQGSATGSLSFASQVPEPATIWLTVSAFLLCLWWKFVTAGPSMRQPAAVRSNSGRSFPSRP
jgi:hypothetical protein